MMLHLILKRRQIFEIKVVNVFAFELRSTHSLQIGVVCNYHLAVSAEMHVTLHQIHAATHRMLKSLCCVLRFFATATTVSSIQGPAFFIFTKRT